MANNGVITWSTTDATNATADSTINWQEGQSPSSVNNSARAMMGRIAELYNDICGTKITSSGSSSAYEVTAAQGWDTYADGMRVAFIANHTNDAAATLNVDGIGAKALRAISATALQVGAIVSGQVYEAVYDAGGDEFLIVNTPPSFSSQTQMEAATSAGTIVTPARQHFHPGHPKAFARFNAAAVVTIDYGISSVTDVGAGEWTPIFDTAFSTNTNFAALFSVANNTGTLRFLSIKDTSQQTTSCTFITNGTGGGQSDPDGPIYVEFLGDL